MTARVVSGTALQAHASTILRHVILQESISSHLLDSSSDQTGPCPQHLEVVLD